MQRIGLAASKIAKGNIWVYHLTIVFISCLFAVFVFLVCGFFIAVTIFLLSLLPQRLLPSVNAHTWVHVFRICLKFLGVLIGIFTLIAILKNIKLRFKL